MSSCIVIDGVCLTASMNLMLQGLSELREALSVSVEDVRCKTVTEASVENCSGEKVTVEYVIRNRSGDRIGLRTDPKTKNVEFVTPTPQKPSVKASIDAARQAYARIRILNEVKNRGYGKVKEEKLPNGSIRLVVERWR